MLYMEPVKVSKALAPSVLLRITAALAATPASPGVSLFIAGTRYPGAAWFDRVSSV